MYITSDKIKFYPSAYRYYVDNNQTHVVNPEASKNTEYNLTSQLAKLFHSTKGCFIVKDDGTNIEFFIGGYYTKINNYASSLLSSFSNDDDVYANLRVALFTPNPNDEGFTDLYEVVPFGTPSNKPLDTLTDGTVYFEGIKFDTSIDANATFSLHLFTKNNGTFVSVEDSKYPITLDDILGNAGKKASDEIKTKILRVTDTIYGVTGNFTGDISAVNLNLSGDASIQQDLEVGGAIYIGEVRLSEGQDNELVIENSIQFAYQDIGMGTSVMPLSSLYVQDIHLGHSLVPLSSGVTLGVSNNRFGTLYNTKVDTNGIDLRGNLVPYNSPNLGTSSYKFNDGYFSGVLRSNVLHTNDLYSNTLSDTSITLHHTIEPSSTTGIYLGKVNNKFEYAYANKFVGNLVGTANNATNLNSMYVGNSKNPVYFSNGVPKASDWDLATYNRINNFLTFQNVEVSNPESSIFNVTLSGITSSSKVYMSMFLLINFNGDKCLVNFVLKNPSPSTGTAYTTHHKCYDVYYRCIVYGPVLVSGTTYRYSVNLQWCQTNASDTSSSWSLVGSEKIQSATVYYTVK